MNKQILILMIVGLLLIGTGVAGILTNKNVTIDKDLLTKAGSYSYEKDLIDGKTRICVSRVEEKLNQDIGLNENVYFRIGCKIVTPTKDETTIYKELVERDIIKLNKDKTITNIESGELVLK